MAKPERTGLSATERIRENLCLVGEELVRQTTGEIVQPGGSRSLVIYVCPGFSIQYHRAKFALAHGWLPEEVDHRDGDRGNNRLDNYRPASRQQQAQNRGPLRRKVVLPRGVYPSGRRFRAMVQEGGRLVSLGSYATPEEAASIVEERLRALHGEFYRCRARP